MYIRYLIFLGGYQVTENHHRQNYTCYNDNEYRSYNKHYRYRFRLFLHNADNQMYGCGTHYNILNQLPIACLNAHDIHMKYLPYHKY